MSSLPEARRRWQPTLAAVLAGLVLLLAAPAFAGTACERELSRARPAVAQQLAAAALREHAAMGGQTIGAEGGLIVQGLAEAELDTDSGGAPAWQRVLSYWQAVPGLYMPWRRATGSEAELRIAMVDRAWSAAFISHLMHSARLADDQFAYSASHHHYVRAAIQTTGSEVDGAATRHAYRACDLATTPAHTGDLLCFARGASGGLDTFAAVRAAVLDGPVQMHCDLVVAREATALEAVGGNVVQSVTLRRMALADDDSGLLWPAYLASAHRGDPSLPPTHLNQQAWSVLLQLRSGAFASTGNPAAD